MYKSKQTFYNGLHFPIIGFIVCFGLCFQPNNVSATITTSFSGGGLTHENMQPSLGLNYIIALQGLFPSQNAPEPTGASLGSNEPTLGEVSLFAGGFAPGGWAFAEGQELSISSYSALHSVLGTTYGGDGISTFNLPDLRGRTAIHAGNGPGLTNRPLGQQIGVNDITLTTDQMPSHEHLYQYQSTSTDITGAGQAHSNLQSSLALNYVVALSGFFPTQNAPEPDGEIIAVGALSSDSYIAGVSMFAGNFAPNGFALADGQLLSTSSNSALFSLLEFTYGGNGSSTFGLPDLRGRAVMHSGTGPGLSQKNLGINYGTEETALTEAQLPFHSHELPFPLGDVESAGNEEAHPNIQPSMPLNYLINLLGTYPSETSGGSGFTGEIGLFAGNFAPRGWALADGQLLLIDDYQPLYSLIGTTYGGDGLTTFALPDLRGRVPVHPDSEIQLGEKQGVENASLNIDQMPAHNHSIDILGDMNSDGYVDRTDLKLFLNIYGRTDTGNIEHGDFNEDGNIGLDDLLIIKQYYTGPPVLAPPPVNSVPEPSTLLLWVIGIVSATFRCWEKKRRINGGSYFFKIS